MMSLLLDKAVQNDVDGHVIKAAALYEQCLADKRNVSVDAFLNLAVLYWVVTDYGYNAGLQLPIDFIHTAGERYEPVLEEAARRFSSFPESTFWIKYTRAISLGEDSFVEECLEMVQSPHCSLVPYFYLFVNIGNEYLMQAQQLLQMCRMLPTTKNIYITSILETGL